MDYTNLMASLSEASLFDLYRLYVAIGNELDNPNRIIQVKKKLLIGMRTSFFCFEENRSIDVTITELRPMKVVARDDNRKKLYVLPYYMINIAGADANIGTHNHQLTINNLQVGDCVGFNKDGREVIGFIERLNQKTVTLKTKCGHGWRVAYQCLFRVTDGTISNPELLIRSE